MSKRTGTRATHHRHRQELRKKLRAQGVPEEEIQRRVSALGQRQALARKERKLREALAEAGHSPEDIRQRVASFRRRHPELAAADVHHPAPAPTLPAEPAPPVRLEWSSRVERMHFRGDGTPKQTYPSREAARGAARATSKLKPRTGVNDAYRCSFCNGWHIGGRPSRRTIRKALK